MPGRRAVAVQYSIWSDRQNALRTDVPRAIQSRWRSRGLGTLRVISFIGLTSILYSSAILIAFHNGLWHHILGPTFTFVALLAYTFIPRSSRDTTLFILGLALGGGVWISTVFGVFPFGTATNFLQDHIFDLFGAGALGALIYYNSSAIRRRWQQLTVVMAVLVGVGALSGLSTLKGFYGVIGGSIVGVITGGLVLLGERELLSSVNEPRRRRADRLQQPKDPGGGTSSDAAGSSISAAPGRPVVPPSSGAKIA